MRLFRKHQAKQTFVTQHNTYLEVLCNKYGSDKGGSLKNNPYPWPSHSYTDIYSQLFDHCRYHIRAVFECGIGTNNPDLPSSMGVNGVPGASLRVWRDYFPNAMIVGADIDKNCLFKADRILTYHMDQTDPESVHAAMKGRQFDLIIDDGLHEFHAGLAFYQVAINHLRHGGVYVIEDVTRQDIPVYKEAFAKSDRNVSIIELSHLRKTTSDNNLIIIR